MATCDPWSTRNWSRRSETEISYCGCQFYSNSYPSPMSFSGLPYCSNRFLAFSCSGFATVFCPIFQLNPAFAFSSSTIAARSASITSIPRRVAILAVCSRNSAEPVMSTLPPYFCAATRRAASRLVSSDSWTSILGPVSVKIAVPTPL